jgi:hypothetical protein
MCLHQGVTYDVPVLGSIQQLGNENLDYRGASNAILAVPVPVISCSGTEMGDGWLKSEMGGWLSREMGG